MSLEIFSTIFTDRNGKVKYGWRAFNDEAVAGDSAFSDEISKTEFNLPTRKRLITFVRRHARDRCITGDWFNMQVEEAETITLDGEEFDAESIRRESVEKGKS